MKVSVTIANPGAIHKNTIKNKHKNIIDNLTAIGMILPLLTSLLHLLDLFPYASKAASYLLACVGPML